MKRINTKMLSGILAGLLALAMPTLLLAQEPYSREQLEEMQRQAQEKAAQEKAAQAKVSKTEPAPKPTPQQAARPESSAQPPAIPLTDPPQDLIGEDGKVELDLVDPFQRSNANAARDQEPEGLSGTSLGEISEEFRILAIIIPDGEFREPMALIQLQAEENPQVVRKDDLVQINRRPQNPRLQARNRTGSGEASVELSALNALESYSFYLQIKEIHPSHIEAFQKKSPNESIILR